MIFATNPETGGIGLNGQGFLGQFKNTPVLQQSYESALPVIQEYNRLVAEGADLQAFVNQQDAGFKNYFNNSLKSGEATLVGYSDSVKGLNSSIKSMTFSAKAAAFATQLLNTALMTGAVFLISWGLTEAVKALQNWIKSDELAIEKSEELNKTWEESKDKLAANKKSLDGVSEEYAKLSKGVDSFGNNVSLTSDEFDRYHTITNQIADIFPELVSGWTKENNAILTVRGSVEELTEAYNNAKTAANNAIIKDAPEAIKGAYLSLYGNPSNGLISTDTEAGTVTQIKLIEKMIADIQKPNFSIQDYGLTSLDNLGSGFPNLEAILKGANISSLTTESIPALLQYKSILESTATTQAEVYRNSAKAFIEENDAFKLMSEQQQQLTFSIVDSLSPETLGEVGPNFAELAAWIEKNVLESVGGLDLSGIINTKSLFDSDEISFGKYENVFDGFIGKIGNLAPEVQAALSELFAPDPQNLVEAVKKKLSTGKDLVSGLSLGDLKIAANFTLENASFEQLSAEIVRAKTESTQSIETLAGSIKTVTEMYSVLDSAISEQADSGAMTYETYSKLIAANGDFANSISMVDGQLQINADKAYDTADAYTALQSAEAEAGKAAKEADLNENVKTLESINEQMRELSEHGMGASDTYNALSSQKDMLEAQGVTLEDQIRAYQVIIGEINSMTSAYSKFKKAQETPNQGAVYDAGAGEMKETLKEGIDSKALNTDETKRAIDFFVGEGDESQAGLKKRSKDAKKVADRYFTEKDPLKGLNNFQKDLLNKKKMGDLAGSITKDKNGTLQIADGVTADQIADQLGMSLEATKAMFDKWEEYDADADWDSLYDKLYPKEPETPETSKTPIETATEQLETTTVTFEQKAKEVADRLLAAWELIKKALIGESSPTTPTTPEGEPKPTTPSDGSTPTPVSPSVPTVVVPPQTVDVVLNLPAEEMTRITGLISGIDGSIPLVADSTQVTQALALLGADIEALPDGTVTISLDDPNGAIGSVASMAEAIELIQSGVTATISIALPPEATQEEITALEASISSLPQDIQSKITIDTTAVQTGVDAATNTLNTISDKNVNIDADTKYISGDVSNVNDLLAGIEDKTVQIIADESDVSASVASAQNDLNKLQDKTITVTIAYEPDGDPENSSRSGATGGGRDTSKKSTSTDTTSESKSADLINVDNIEEAQTQMTIFEAIWLRIKSLFTGEDYLVDSVINPTAQSQIDTAQTGLSGIADTSIPEKSITVNDDAAITENTELEAKLGKSVDKVVNVTYKGVSHSAWAKGTKRAKKGVSLVDEEGAEVIEHQDGTYEIGTDDGARLTMLQEGDVVHDAEDSKKIFKRGIGSLSNVRGGRFASGTLPTSGGGSSSSSSSSSSSNSSSSKKSKKNNWKKYIDQLFDWIEIRLNRLQEITDKWTRQIEHAIGFVEKNKAIDSTISSISQQIDALEQAAVQYQEQANTIASKTKLSQDIINKIKNGTMDITLYSSDMQKKIQEYMEWYEKAKDTEEAIADLKDEQDDLIHQKMDNIINQYESLVDVIDQVREKAQASIDYKVASGQEVTEADYQPAVDAQKDKIEKLQEELSILTAEFDKQIQEGTLVVGSDAWYDYVKQISELDLAIINARTDLEDLNDSVRAIVITNLTSLLTALQTTQQSIEQTLSLIEAQGRLATTDTFKQLIANGMQQIANLEQQNNELRAQQVGLDVLSEKYQEIQSQLDGNLDAIDSIKVSQEEWNDSILDLRIDELTRLKDELDKTNDQYQRSLNLQQAIEDLERAKSQRTIRILEGGQFKYVADTQDVAEKQQALDEQLHNETIAKIDEAIDAIEDMKSTSNVYAPEGWTPTSLAQMYPGATIDELITAVLASVSAGVGLTDLAQSASNNLGSLVTTNNNTNSNNVTFGTNSIVINAGGVDANEIFSLLQSEIGSILVQDNYGN